MNAITTIKNTGLALAIFNQQDELIATATKITQYEPDAKLGQYRIAIVGGPAHGKLSYAQDFQDLNDKSVEIATIK